MKISETEKLTRKRNPISKSSRIQDEVEKRIWKIGRAVLARIRLQNGRCGSFVSGSFAYPHISISRQSNAIEQFAV